MKPFVCVAIIASGLPIAGGCQYAVPRQGDVAQTKGVCSPIASNNSGSITITCSGFSKRQNRRIVALLRQLSDQQASEQDALLMKMEEILDTLRAAQKISAPRTIPLNMQELIVSHSRWDMCTPPKVTIVAPQDDSEAQDLALSIGRVLQRAGMRPYITDGQIKRGPTETMDLKTVSTDSNGLCIERFLIGNLKRRFTVVSEEHRSSDAVSSERIEKPPFYIYVYPR